MTTDKTMPTNDVDRNPLPRSIARGELALGEVRIECHVLDDEHRVISARGMVGALNGVGAKDGHSERRIARILSENSGFELGPRIRFAISGAPPGYGYPAEILPRLCSAITDRALEGKLHHKQVHVAATPAVPGMVARRLARCHMGVRARPRSRATSRERLTRWRRGARRGGGVVRGPPTATVHRRERDREVSRGGRLAPWRGRPSRSGGTHRAPRRAGRPRGRKRPLAGEPSEHRRSPSERRRKALPHHWRRPRVPDCQRKPRRNQGLFTRRRGSRRALRTAGQWGEEGSDCGVCGV